MNELRIGHRTVFQAFGSVSGLRQECDALTHVECARSAELPATSARIAPSPQESARLMKGAKKGITSSFNSVQHRSGSLTLFVSRLPQSIARQHGKGRKSPPSEAHSPQPLGPAGAGAGAACATAGDGCGGCGGCCCCRRRVVVMGVEARAVAMAGCCARDQICWSKPRAKTSSTPSAPCVTAGVAAKRPPRLCGSG